MSNKLVKSTPEERQKQEDEKYLYGKPNRIEVMNYVNALFEEKMIPEVQNQTLGCRLGLMVLQAVLVDKGICTGEELEEVTKAFIEKQNSEQSQNETK